MIDKFYIFEYVKNKQDISYAAPNIITHMKYIILREVIKNQQV